MRLARMPRWVLAASVLILIPAAVLPPPVTGQETRKVASSDRPGDDSYVPTKLEWATLQLQANFGTEWTRDDHVAVSYMREADGKTVRCVLQYTPDVSAQALKTSRDVAQATFERYQASRGWSWLRLAFEERPLPAPH